MLVIKELIYGEQSFIHKLTHVGCRRLWARVSKRLPPCGYPAHQVMHAKYLLLVLEVYSGTNRCHTVRTVILSEEE
jgi:hypothetical protein